MPILAFVPFTAANQLSLLEVWNMELSTNLRVHYGDPLFVDLQVNQTYRSTIPYQNLLWADHLNNNIPQ